MKAFTRKTGKRGAPESEKIDRFIRQFLANGPRPTNDVKKAANEQGFNRYTFDSRLTRLTEAYQEPGRIGHMRRLIRLTCDCQQQQSLWPYPHISPDSLSDPEFFRMLDSSPTDDPLIRRILYGPHGCASLSDEDEDEAELEREEEIERSSLAKAIGVLRDVLLEVEGLIPDGASATDAFTAIERRLHALQRENSPSQY